MHHTYRICIVYMDQSITFIDPCIIDIDYTSYISITHHGYRSAIVDIDPFITALEHHIHKRSMHHTYRSIHHLYRCMHHRYRLYIIHIDYISWISFSHCRYRYVHHCYRSMHHTYRLSIIDIDPSITLIDPCIIHIDDTSYISIIHHTHRL